MQRRRYQGKEIISLKGKEIISLKGKANLKDMRKSATRFSPLLEESELDASEDPWSKGVEGFFDYMDRKWQGGRNNGGEKEYSKGAQDSNQCDDQYAMIRGFVEADSLSKRTESSSSLSSFGRTESSKPPLPKSRKRTNFSIEASTQDMRRIHSSSEVSERTESSQLPYASRIPWLKKPEGIHDYMEYKWQGGQNDDGRYTRLENLLQLQCIADKIAKAKGSIVIVSNRGPMGYERISDEVFKEVPGAGGVAVALRSIKECAPDLIKFLSVPMTKGDRDAAAIVKKLGYVPIEGKEHNESSNKNNRKSSLRKTRSMNDIEQKRTENAENEFVTTITDEDFKKYYNDISNDVLWFLFHGMKEHVSGRAEDIKRGWESYIKANQAYADKLSEMIEKEQEQGKKPIVMLNDYHLLHVSDILRKKHQNIVLQQFIHIPSPEPENLSKPENLHDRPSEIVEDIYKGLSGKDIYKGLSGNDILGFQTKKDATNFLEGVKRFLPDDAKVNLNESTISWENGHSTQVRVYPISIDVDKTREMANAANRESAKEMKKIISVGRMDPTKNDVRIFRGYDLMLEQHPEVRGSVIFAPRLVPSRQEVPAYQQLRQDIEETIKGTNEQFGDGSYTPIQPNYGNDQMHAVGQMASADVVAVIPEKDGMNMVALEAVSIMEDGVLVLSEKAGAHEQLKEGVLSVGDPKNIKEIADRIFEALKMSPEERQRRTAVARKVVEKNDLFQWQFNQFSDIYEVLKSK